MTSDFLSQDNYFDLITLSILNVFWEHKLDIPTLASNIQGGIPIINKITVILKSKLINLSGEINSSLTFNFTDKSQPSKLAITWHSLMKQVKIRQLFPQLVISNIYDTRIDINQSY